MGARSCLTVVLAAGEGTRMRSSRPKVLHAVGGRPLVVHVLEAVKETDGAYVGSGSVITRNVPADALAVGRGRQEIKEGWASRLRAAKSAGTKDGN